MQLLAQFLSVRTNQRHYRRYPRARSGPTRTRAGAAADALPGQPVQQAHLRQDVVVCVRPAELLPQHGDQRDGLTEAMHVAVLGAGKRIRPLLLISIVRELGHDAPALLDLACSIELVHAASLILDDLPCMDEAA